MARGSRSALESLLWEEPAVASPRHLGSQCVSCGSEECEECEGCRVQVCARCEALHSSQDCHLLARAGQLGLLLSPEVVMMVRLVSLSKQGGELWDHIGELSSAQLVHITSFHLQIRWWTMCRKGKRMS